MTVPKRTPRPSSFISWISFHRLSLPPTYLLTLTLVCLTSFYLQLGWFITNVIPTYPWAPQGLIDNLNRFLNIGLGAFVVHILGPLRRAGLRLLTNPRDLPAHPLLRQLTKPTALFATLAATFLLYLVIISRPFLHLTHAADSSESGSRPVLHLGDQTHYLARVPLRLPLVDTVVANAVLTGRHDLYRVRLEDRDYHNPWLIPNGHKRITLDTLFVDNNLNIVYTRGETQKTIEPLLVYHDSLSLSDQCVERGFHDVAGVSEADCAPFIRAFFGHMADSSESRFRRNVMIHDTIEHPLDDRSYPYWYRSTATNVSELTIDAPTIRSPLINESLQGWGVFVDASERERSQLVEEFADDLNWLSERRRDDMFAELFDVVMLRRYVDDSPSAHMNSLEFVSRILAYGVRFVPGPAVDTLIGEIVGETFALDTIGRVLHHQDVFLRGVDAVLALSAGRPARRSRVLAELLEFADNLGTDHTRPKIDLVRKVLGSLEEIVDGDVWIEVANIVRTLYLNSVNETVSATQMMERLIVDARDQAPDPMQQDRLTELLDEVRDARQSGSRERPTES